MHLGPGPKEDHSIPSCPEPSPRLQGPHRPVSLPVGKLGSKHHGPVTQPPLCRGPGRDIYSWKEVRKPCLYILCEGCVGRDCTSHSLPPPPTPEVLMTGRFPPVSTPERGVDQDAQVLEVSSLGLQVSLGLSDLLGQFVSSSGRADSSSLASLRLKKSFIWTDKELGCF